MNIKKYYLGLGIFALILVFTTIFVLTAEPRNTAPVDNDIDQEVIDVQASDLLEEPPSTQQPTEDLSGVNSEERNSIAVKLGLPYENDVFYIHFSPVGNDNARIYVFDKTNNGKITEPVKQQVFEYMRARGVSPESLDIRYEAAP